MEYCKKYPEAANALLEWYHELVVENFRNFNELKQKYRNASIVSDDRVIFNIAGNKFRLAVRVVFDYKVIQIKWFGTHAEYDKVNMNEIKFRKS